MKRFEPQGTATSAQQLPVSAKDIAQIEKEKDEKEASGSLQESRSTQI